MTREERRRLEREQERTRRKVLAAELALLLLLRRSVRAAERDASRVALTGILATTAIEAGRSKAREVGLAGLERELRAAGSGATLTLSDAVETRAARRAGAGIARRLSELLGEARRRTARALSRALDPTLEVVATTEAFDAFAAERRRAARGLGIDIIRTWSALLDRRTCPKCAELDGTEVRGEAEFPDGDPPAHPRCRCIVFVEPA